MSVGPFPVNETIERLKAQVPTLKLAGNSADLRTALKTAPNAVPAAYVLAEEKGDKPNFGTGGVTIQSVIVAVQVVLFVRNFAQELVGSAARREMDELIAAVRIALVGWKPTDKFMQLSFQAARDESYDAGLLVCQEIYRSQYRIQTTAP